MKCGSGNSGNTDLRRPEPSPSAATARGVVNLVATNFGLFEVTEEGLALREIAPGVAIDEVKAATGCNLLIPREVPPVRMAG